MKINKQTEKGIDITFCSSCKNCPSIVLTKDFDTVILGGKDEGFSEWKKEQFKELVNSAKDGMFDKYFD